MPPQDASGAEAAACFEQGLALLESQAWQPALEAFSRGLTLDPRRTGLWHNRAWCHLQLGDLAAAQADLLTLIELEPGHAPALALLGRVRLAQGATDEGIALLERAWLAAPQDAPIARQALQALLLRPQAEQEAAHRARLLAQAGQLDRESAQLLQGVLILSEAGQQALRALWAGLCTGAHPKPWMFEAWTHLCRAEHQADERALAATLWLRCEPHSESARLALMSALAHQGDIDALLPMAMERARGQPGDVQAMVDLALLLTETTNERLRDAGLCVLAHALSLHPADARPWLQRGHYHAKVFLHEAAIQDFRQALQIQPDIAGARGGVVCSLASLGRHEEARQALQDFVPHSAAQHLERETAHAFLLRAEARLPQAQAVLEHCAQPLHPAAQWELGCVLLTQGCYERGWAQWRHLGRSRPRSHWHRFLAQGARPWQGDVAQVRGRTLAVVSDTGLGDALQFARFLPALQAQGVNVLLCVQPALRGLLAHTRPRLRLVDETEPLPVVDFVCSLWDVPMLLDVRLESLDRWGPAHYLHLDDAAPQAPASVRRLSGPLRVALGWRGMRSPLAERSIDLRRLEDLQIPGVQWHSLQHELSPGTETEAARRMGLLHEGWSLRDAARAIAGMDAVVSVDTVFCHLAGALGRPFYILLPLACDWRWGTAENANTPWYPQATLLRQRRAGDWREPLAELGALLQAQAKLCDCAESREAADIDSSLSQVLRA